MIKIENKSAKPLRGEFNMVVDGDYRLSRYCEINPHSSTTFRLADFASEGGQRFDTIGRKPKRFALDLERFKPVAFELR
ncbi:MAG: hypothetical protein ABS95_01735 [Verrucomicrobia bacterium SCN 57-15]|nr:MAG: hypothetical protein ABS95_01735 [Verrucomicrobia bacterium SCN 57-15]